MKALLTLAVLPAFALVEQTIDEKQPKRVHFSTSTHNRIAVENGVVEKAFGDPSYFSINIDPTTGNAFVNLLKPTEEHKTITLTVVTDAGSIQDLLVTASEGVSEQVILKEKEELAEQKAASGPAVDVINAILARKIPHGYGLRDLHHLPMNLNLPEPLRSQLIASYEGPFEVILVYEIKNHGGETILMTPEALQKEDRTWVLLTAPELERNAKALCLIGGKKE
jgi:hypothetical protein